MLDISLQFVIEILSCPNHDDNYHLLAYPFYCISKFIVSLVVVDIIPEKKRQVDRVNLMFQND